MFMNDITHILEQIEQGDISGSDRLLPLVYYELRRLEARRLASEVPDHTLRTHITAFAVSASQLASQGDDQSPWLRCSNSDWKSF